jgi:hypothetical protein
VHSELAWLRLRPLPFLSASWPAKAGDQPEADAAVISQWNWEPISHIQMFHFINSNAPLTGCIQSIGMGYIELHGGSRKTREVLGVGSLDVLLVHGRGAIWARFDGQRVPRMYCRGGARWGLATALLGGYWVPAGAPALGRANWAEHPMACEVCTPS